MNKQDIIREREREREREKKKGGNKTYQLYEEKKSKERGRKDNRG